MTTHMIQLLTIIPLHAAVIAAGLLTYVVATRVRHQRRHPYSALAWVIGIIAFPYLALPIFLAFGTRKTVRPLTKRQPVPVGSWAALAPVWVTQLLASLGVAAARPQANVMFQADGAEALQAVKELIASAQHTLDICTYVLADDEVGILVADALKKRAAAGVRVRLLVDSIGSLKTPRGHDAALRAAGIETRRFMPPLRGPRRGRTNLRNHRKILVADGLRLWAGGRNLADEYFITRNGQEPWRDLSFTAHGVLATQALALFEGDWQIADGLQHTLDSSYVERAAKLEIELHARASAPAGPAALSITAPESPLTVSIAEAISLAHWVPTGPDFHEDILHALLVSSAFHASQRMLMVTPYFVPDEGLVEALLLAAKRGVQVTLVLPRRSNHRLADLARGRAMRVLASNGVNVSLVPGMLHAKAVVVDDVLALCGSANLDSRSLFLNYEAMAAFYGSAEIEWLARWIEQTAALGQPASAQAPSVTRDVLEGLVGAVAFQL